MRDQARTAGLAGLVLVCVAVVTLSSVRQHRSEVLLPFLSTYSAPHSGCRVSTRTNAILAHEELV